MIAILALRTLSMRSDGISPAYGSALAEAAAVCFECQNHSSGVMLGVEGDFTEVFSLAWDGLEEQARRSWNDLQVATEWGACGVSLLLITELTALVVVERSRKNTGFDYWLGASSASQLFQGPLVRLEISGIMKGTATQLAYRVEQKTKQARRLKTFPEGLISVVNFHQPSTIIRKDEWK